ncbi:MAG TPA: EAL domain-containing protein [Burkholderiales bacterium]|nr:EAL domain-containing protein [Burkholderiales bacterium]
MNWFLQTKSLRLKLVLITVLVEVVMLTLLVGNSIWMIDNVLDEQSRARMKMLAPMLSDSLGAALAQDNQASVRQILAGALAKEELAYALFYDDKGKLLAGDGSPLPKADPQNVYETWVPIEREGKTYGSLRLGISTDFLNAAKQKLFWESLVIAGGEVALSLLLFLALGYWLVRHLGEIAEAGRAMASGNYSVRVAVASADEVGKLTTTFNAMAEAVENQIKTLLEGEATFRAIADYSHDWELWVDPAGKVIWVNPSVKRLTGYLPEECLEMPDFPAAIIDPEDNPRFREFLQKILRGTRGSGLEFRVRRKDGSSFWASATWQPIYGRQGEYLGVRCSIRDITERKNEEFNLQATIKQLELAQGSQHQDFAQAREERARLVSLLTAMDMGILFVGKEGVAYYNPTLIRIWGFTQDIHLQGMNTENLLAVVTKQVARPQEYAQHVLQVADAEDNSKGYEFTLADGRTLLETTYLARGDDGQSIGRLWVYKDITQERRDAEQLIYLAERDALTGLYNRHRFQQELGRMIADADRHGSALGLLFFDLDEFKHINDTYGHRAGDAILIRVAGEVNAQVRRNEIFSRLGGDEFAILIPDVVENELHIVAERIVHSISQITFHFEGQNLRLTTSLGIAMFPDNAGNAEELVARADAAMYQAKEAGKNAWRVYQPHSDSSREILSRIAWSNRIRNALHNDQMCLNFQGVYRAADGQRSHIETLLRMKDETGGVIMPAAFIPLAEKSDIILELDRWVISKIIALLASSSSVPSIAVNISGRSFAETELPLFISDTLRKFDVNPSRLMVEITETSAVTNLHDAQRFIKALHQIGCVVCLDDFGSGFSSFAYLKHLEVDIVKIDGLFIRNLPNDQDNQIFVKAIIDVARGMHKTTVAESVEDLKTLEMLKNLGVDMVQGYYLEMPHPDLMAAAKV